MKKIIIILSITFLGLIPFKVLGAVEAVTLEDTSVFRYAVSSSAKLGTIPKGSNITLISPKNLYYEIVYDNKVGWIKKSDVQVTLVDGLIKDDKVKYTSSPQENGNNKLGNFSEGTKLNITAVISNYCEVQYGDVLVYVLLSHIYSDKLHLLPFKEPNNIIQKTDITSQKIDVTFKGDGKDIAFFAMNYIGGTYVWGGNNLETGVDCSGFVRQVYKKFDIHLQGASYQLVKYGNEISNEELTYGDLVFFTSGGTSIGHVGIYISNDYFVHASSPSQGIIISKFSSRNDFVIAKRILN